MSHLYKQGAVCQLQDIMEENPEDRHQTDLYIQAYWSPKTKELSIGTSIEMPTQVYDVGIVS